MTTTDLQTAQAPDRPSLPSALRLGRPRDRHRGLPRRLRRRLLPEQARRGPQAGQHRVPARVGRLDQGRQRGAEVHHRAVDPRLRRVPARGRSDRRPTRPKITAAIDTLSRRGRGGDRRGRQAVTKGEVAGVYSIAVPLVYKQRRTPSRSRTSARPRRSLIEAARDGPPAGLDVYEAGAAGLIGAFSESFDGLDTIAAHSRRWSSSS